jgi:hypothetical protein
MRLLPNAGHDLASISPIKGEIVPGPPLRCESKCFPSVHEVPEIVRTP